MVNHNSLPDNKPSHEGILHGPFPPPELDYEPKSARWVHDSVEGHPEKYQLQMQREEVIKAYADRHIDEKTYETNIQNIESGMQEIRWQTGLRRIREIKQTRPFLKDE